MNFLEHHSLYVVGIISSVIWLGLFLFMFGIERRIRKLEKDN
jgi:hypothetical protein